MLVGGLIRFGLWGVRGLEGRKVLVPVRGLFPEGWPRVKALGSKRSSRFISTKEPQLGWKIGSNGEREVVVVDVAFLGRKGDRWEERGESTGGSGDVPGC